LRSVIKVSQRGMKNFTKYEKEGSRMLENGS